MSLSQKQNASHSVNKKLLIGFDDFIDEVLHVVKNEK